MGNKCILRKNKKTYLFHVKSHFIHHLQKITPLGSIKFFADVDFDIHVNCRAFCFASLMVNKFRENQCIIKNGSAFNQRRLFIGYTFWRSGLSLLAKVLEMILYKMLQWEASLQSLMIFGLFILGIRTMEFWFSCSGIKSCSSQDVATEKISRP